MLLIETTVGPSDIHGLGCFTIEFIPKGKVVWEYDRRIDLIFYESGLSKFPKPFQSCLEFYGFASTNFFRRCLVLCGDNSRHMNHSDTPNLVANAACRDIDVGEELTCDYRSYDLDADKKLGRHICTVATNPSTAASTRHR